MDDDLDPDTRRRAAWMKYWARLYRVGMLNPRQVDALIELTYRRLFGQ